MKSAWGWANGGQPILVRYIQKYIIILGDIPIDVPQPKYWGMCPRHPRRGWRQRWSLCLCLSDGSRALRAVIKPLNWSRCRLGLWTRRGPINHILRGDVDRPPRKKRTNGVTLGHAQTCRRSIFSTLFARGPERRVLWLPSWLPAINRPIYTVNHKKVHPFDFYNKFVKCSPNVIIFGRNIAASILYTVA